MCYFASVIWNSVPVSLYNRVFDSKILDEVKQSGAKAVMNNNSEECVLWIPEEDMSLIDGVNDARLLMLPLERMAKVDVATFVPAERLYEDIGIMQDVLDTVGVVDIEWIETGVPAWSCEKSEEPCRKPAVDDR